MSRPDFCTCDDGYWMRDLIDPDCHYHGDYADILRELIREKDLVIETMNEAHKLLIAEKDAEIERLKDVQDILSKENHVLYARITGYDKLITELCDALEDVRKRYEVGHGYIDLLQRAREATR